MAHKEQRQFCLSVKNRFPEKFRNVAVLDIGSLDINGNNRYLFSDFAYVGVDLAGGKNVDVVCRGHEFKADKQFDVVISTECFEHDEFYGLTIKNMYEHLKPGGLFIFTCATKGRPEHGTKTTSPEDSPFTQGYYKNLVKADIKRIIDVRNSFSKYKFSVNRKHRDLFFWGIKRF